MNATSVLTTRVLQQQSTIAVTEVNASGISARQRRSHERSAYFIALRLRACRDHDLYFDGRRVRPKNFSATAASIYDLTRYPVADIGGLGHFLMLYTPWHALESVANEPGAPRAGHLCDEPGTGIDDPVVRHLLSALLPALTKPDQVHALVIDHLALALTVHVAQVYGGPDIIRKVPRGGLAPWQERRAKELMSANLHEEMPLSRLGAACGLSVRHFARAFRQSTGIPPHRWLRKHRIERAMELMNSRALPLADIALSCGFADQSHFTRVFTALVGTSPNAWRRTIGAAEDLINSAKSAGK